ncbi:UNVERIFIED_CONTAM: hypothetical protein FKN15_075018 [Acipenser sinensis]
MTPPALHAAVPLPGETLWDPCAPLTVRLPLYTTRPCLYQGNPRGPLRSPDCMTPPALHAAVPLPGETLVDPCAPMTVRLPLHITRPCLYQNCESVPDESVLEEACGMGRVHKYLLLWSLL